MTRRTKDFCTLIREGMKDEKSADGYYTRLNTALREHASSDPDLRRDLDILDRIRDDEQGHHVALTALHNRRCP